MDDRLCELADKIIESFELRTIPDVIRTLPISMCHIVQEPRVFNTYQPQIVRLAFPEEEWERYNQIYRTIRDELIPSITTIDYLSNLLSSEPKRLPCFGSEMADAAAVIVNRLLGTKVYVLRYVSVDYLYLPQRRHCINAILDGSRVRYFDVSAYAQVLDKTTRGSGTPDRLPGFDASDIEEGLILSEDRLQKDPFPRRIFLQDGELVDTFHPCPVNGKPADEYFRVVH
jgi:hypothetical protein